ncbi:MAG: SDR family NAD(P)-dependent oxidoreductase [bacterium]
MSKRVIITGGAGFIGSHTVEEFLLHDYEVVVIDNLSSGLKKNLENVSEKIKFVEGDIRDKSLLTENIRKGDIVVHLAGFISVPDSILRPEESHDINVNGTNTLYVVAKDMGAKRVVTASSAAIYGEPEMIPQNENNSLKSFSPYALHKTIIEKYAELYSRIFCVEHVAMRFFNVYGPRQASSGGYAAVIPIFMEKIKNDIPAEINGDGSAVRDFIYVKDVARVLRLAAEFEMTKDVSNSAVPAVLFNYFNIATGKPSTINELWSNLCKIMDKDIQPIYKPFRIGDVHTSLADVSKAKEMLKFEAETSFFDGLKSML